MSEQPTCTSHIPDYAHVQDKILREGARKFDRPAIAAVAATTTSPAIAALEEVKFHFSWWYAYAQPPLTLQAPRAVIVCCYV